MFSPSVAVQFSSLINELLASLSGVTDETERKEIYENLENKLIDEDAVIYLNRQTLYFQIISCLLSQLK